MRVEDQVYGPLDEICRKQEDGQSCQKATTKEKEQRPKLSWTLLPLSFHGSLERSL